MKLIRFANEQSESSLGFIYGIFQDDIVELTNCQPIQGQLDVESQQDMDIHISQYYKKHHLDNNKSGLYFIGDRLDQFQFENFEQLHRLQTLAGFSILLTYSPQLSLQGHPMPFQAYQISELYLDLYLRDEIPSKELNKWNSKEDKIYTQIPVELTKSPLVQVINIFFYICQQFLFQSRKDLKQKYTKPSQLQTNALNSSRLLIDTIDDQIQSADKINQWVLKKLEDKKQEKVVDEEQYTQVGDMIEYFLTIHKTNQIATSLKRQAYNVIESEPLIIQLTK